MTQQLFDLFKRNFSYLRTDDDTAKNLFSNKDNKVFARYDRFGNLIGASVIYKNTIVMLAVDEKYRGHGIGSALLDLSEGHIKDNGYEKAVFGVGASDYLAPGVPSSEKLIEIEGAYPDDTWTDIDNSGRDFLIKRGYVHKNDDNIFDMALRFDGVPPYDISVGDTIDGVTYRLAELSDKDGVIACCSEGADYFTGYYKDDKLYKDGEERVLVACMNGEVVGNLLISTYKELGTIGCVTVSPKARNKKIGTRMTVAATSYIRQKGFSTAFLSYTYSGLDKMYGEAGYRVCIYYFMAQKEL